MPNTWITHCGTPFHGMDITWTHDPTAATKTLTVHMNTFIYSTVMYILAKKTSGSGPDTNNVA